MEGNQIDPRKRLLWFFGPSAAGKKKLACELAMQENHQLKELLGGTKQPQLCQESLTLNGSSRRDLLKIVPAQIRPTTCLLLKGQTDDFKHDVPGDLRHELPHVQYLLVFLWVAPEIQLSRVHSRIGGKWSTWQPRDCAYELDIQIQETEKLRQMGFDVLCFNSSDEIYTRRDWQEVLQRSNIAPSS